MVSVTYAIISYCANIHKSDITYSRISICLLLIIASEDLKMLADRSVNTYWWYIVAFQVLIHSVSRQVAGAWENCSTFSICCSRFTLNIFQWIFWNFLDNKMDYYRLAVVLKTFRISEIKLLKICKVINMMIIKLFVSILENIFKSSRKKLLENYVIQNLVNKIIVLFYSLCLYL